MAWQIWLDDEPVNIAFPDYRRVDMAIRLGVKAGTIPPETRINVKRWPEGKAVPALKLPKPRLHFCGRVLSGCFTFIVTLLVIYGLIKLITPT